MAAYRQVYDKRHLQADCQEPGAAPEPYARQSSIGYLYLVYFTLLLGRTASHNKLQPVVADVARFVCLCVFDTAVSPTKRMNQSTCYVLGGASDPHVGKGIL